MVLTMNDCLTEFHAVTGYTHSDEITLIFAPMPPLVNKNTNKVEPQPHFYNGRVCKILTLVSSYISIRFNYHLLSCIETQNQYIQTLDMTKIGYSNDFIRKIKNMKAYFDARVLVFPQTVL